MEGEKRSPVAGVVGEGRSHANDSRESEDDPECLLNWGALRIACKPGV